MKQEKINEHIENLNSMSKIHPQGYIARILVLEDKIDILDTQGVEVQKQGE